jgi:glutamine amidotransferase
MAEASRPVVVVDYGLGNLFSVSRALAAAGGTPTLTSDPDALLSAERLVLPGVGSFGDGINGLRERGLIEPLRSYARTGRPLIGLCLGMQLLLTSGDEFGLNEGLGLIPGRVTLLAPQGQDGRPLKMPHIGWSELVPGDAGWKGGPLEDLAPRSQVYFVHSYAPQPDDQAHALAYCDYGTTRFCAAVRRDNLSGCQFHPEKSGPYGLMILSRFLRQ